MANQEIVIRVELSPREISAMNSWNGNPERINRILIDNQIPIPAAKVIAALQVAVKNWKVNVQD